MLAAAPVISEFMAANAQTLADSNGNHPDWIELYNAGDVPIDLAGWHLTDDPANLTQWTFPTFLLAPGEFRVVFASGCEAPSVDCPAQATELHTNFRLDAEGDFVALVASDGQTIVSSYGLGGAQFPNQFEDTSYGLVQTTQLVAAGAAAHVLVPTSDALGVSWTAPAFMPDATWTSGPTGVGFDSGGGGGTPLPGGTAILSLDLNDRDSTDGAADTQTGFTSMTLNQNGANFGGVTVTLSPLGGATLDDRDRATPTNNPPSLTQAQIYDDFIFANGMVDGAGMEIRLQGLNPGAEYRVTLWSFDSGSTPGRVSDWNEVASGTPMLIEDNYTFDGGELPSGDNDYTLSANLTASATGELRIQGIRNGGASHGVFVNALQIVRPGISQIVTTDIQAAMHNQNASAYVRLPFNVPVDADYDLLTLRMKYDAGFVAYLNGTEVARGNAPGAVGAPPASNAAATVERTLDQTLVFEEINLTSAIGLLDPGGTNLLAIHGLNSAAGDGDFVILPELSAASLTGNEIHYFPTPTPGGPNGVGYIGFVEDTSFDHDRGFYAAPFDVVIATPTAGADIYYTLDGSPPSPTNPTATLYSAPLHINTTTTLRAAAVKTGFRPTDVDTQTYLFLDHVIRQGEIGVNYVQIGDANTVGTVSGIANWRFATPNGASTTLWVPRTTFGTFGTTWQSSAVVAPEGAPALTTTLSGLTPGEPYNVFVNYWDADAPNDWTVRAGLSAGSLAQFTAANGYFTGQASGDRLLYNGFVGTTTADAGGTIRVYLDDIAPNTSATRSWIDSVGWSQGEVPTHVPRAYPAVWQATATGDFAMDPQVVSQWDDNNPANTDYGIREALASIPTMSIVMDQADLWDKTNGIYPNSTGRGDAWRRPGSIEYFDPATGAEFQFNVGVQMHGNASRDNVRLKKHSFRLVFADEFDGPNNLNFPLFGDNANDQINTLVLRACFTDAFATRTQTDRYSPLDSMYLRDAWVRETQLAMGHGSAHNAFVHLYINGMYWGLHNAAERPDDAFMGEYFGGPREDWDIIKDFDELFRGNRTAWDSLFALTDQLTVANADAIYQQVQGKNPDGSLNPTYPKLLDVNNLIDFMILHLYAGAEDWPHHNWYAARRRTGETTGFQFFVWDQEIVLDGRYRDRTEVADAGPAELYSKLRNSPAFRQQFADRVHKHLFNDGALTTAANQARWMAMADRVEKAIIAESARWGDARKGESIVVSTGQPAVIVPTMTVNHWRAERNNVRDNYFVQHRNLLLQRLTADGLYPAVAAPVFNQHGGVVLTGFGLEMSDPNSPDGTIWYTTDGSDPSVPTTLSPVTLLPEFSAVAVLVPSVANGGSTLTNTGTNIDQNWTLPDFTGASTWQSGNAGVGYDRDPAVDFDPLIGVDVEAQMFGINPSVYTRFEFNVDNPSDLTSLSLQMKVDDGYAAYLNGFEVHRRLLAAGATWNSAAQIPTADATAITFQTFDITAHLGRLVAGRNVLAIHGATSVNATNNVDLLVSPRLVGTRMDGTGIAPSAQPYMGMIPLLQSATLSARVRVGNTWSALSQALFTVELPLRISEVMYHPVPPTANEMAGGFADDEDFEFVEVVNISSVATIDLSGVQFIDGIQFTFGDLDLGPGERLVVARNQAALEARYGAGIPIAGQYGGTPDDVRLSNNGETITLVDAAGGMIQSFRYDDGWHAATDGEGPSLVVVDETADRSNWEIAAGWRASFNDRGSPGTADLLPGDFNVNNRVDAFDLALLQASLGTASGATRAQGDMNGDGAVGRLDLALFVSHLGRSYPPPAPSSPEAVIVRASEPPTTPSTAPVLAARRTRAALSPPSVDQVLANSLNVPRTLSARRVGRVFETHPVAFNSDLVGLADSTHPTNHL
jgi:hypothetical protein